LGFISWDLNARVGGPDSPASSYAALQYKWCGAKFKSILRDVDEFRPIGLGNALNLPKFVL